ncbi:MAG: PAS domain S-box protein [Gemmatimonadales bacterium]|nr:MAG: PAS domain S-box protein [Gemmatimonadales bacterium]
MIPDTTRRKAIHSAEFEHLRDHAMTEPSTEENESSQLERDRLLAGLSSVSDAVIMTDREGRIVFLNPVAEVLSGWTQDAVGEPVAGVVRILDEQSRQAVELPTMQALRDNGAVRSARPRVFVGADGTERAVTLSGFPFAKDQGEVKGAVLVFRDISLRRGSERALQQAVWYTNDIIATLREPFLVLDRDLRVETANRAFYAHFGVSPEETEDRLVFELGNGQWDIPGLRKLLDEVLSRTEPINDYEVDHTFPDLGRRTMLLNARPFPPESRNPTLILLAMEDVSAMRERAEELVESDRRRNEFLATLAHEIRNPLAPIRSALQIVRLSGMEGKGVRTATEMGERQVELMVRLVEDLLDVSRISRGEIALRRERVELGSCLRHAVESVAPSCQERDHTLSVTVPAQPIYLNADPVRLDQVVVNLLVNACKYTERGGRIALSVEQDGEFAVIRVTDSGIGIAPDQLARIFDLFVQVDTTLERSAGGLGVGLALVRHLVEQHEGTVEVESAGIGRGSEFVVRLPVAVATPTRREHVLPAEPPGRGSPPGMATPDPRPDQGKGGPGRPNRTSPPQGALGLRAG